MYIYTQDEADERSGRASWAGAACAAPAEGLAGAPRLRLGAGAGIAATVFPARALLMVHGGLVPCSRYAATSCPTGAWRRAAAPVVAHHSAASHVRHYLKVRALCSTVATVFCIYPEPTQDLNVAKPKYTCRKILVLIDSSSFFYLTSLTTMSIQFKIGWR